MSHVVSEEGVPAEFPTHLHEPKFWEELGRAVATFGFLEEVLGKAIFAFTGTRKRIEEVTEAQLLEWLAQLERALSDPLGGLIDTYGRAVREHPDSTITNLDDLLNGLRDAAKLRNAICHGSWRSPDENGCSKLLYVTRQQEVFDTAVDVAFLKQLQRNARELSLAVINTVTHMGWQFPGSGGPGKKVL